MRTVPVLVAVASLATACEWQPTFFEHQSTLYQATRGVALDATPSGEAQVGMLGTTCAVDPTWGTAGTDYDYPGSDDTVDDISDEGVVVITGDDKVHLQHTVDGWSTTSEDFTVRGVQVARATDDGAVAIAGTSTGCSVEWVGSSRESVSLKPDTCAAVTDLAADPGGNAFVGTTVGVYSVDPTGITQITDEGGEIVEFDAVTGVLYTADAGGTTVHGVDSAGNELWNAPMAGPVRDLTDMGTEASVAVSIDMPNGSGMVVVLDGYTGLQVSTLSLPTPADQVTSNSTGTELAVIDDSRVAFFTMTSLW